MSFLNDLSKEFTNANILDEGGNSSEFSGSIDTGSYIMNAVLSGSLYGGVPNNKITAFAGESATGKTFFVLGVLKAFLDKNPDDGVVIYFDTEAAVTKKMMEDRGINTKKVLIVEPESIEEFRTEAVKVLDKYLDSEDQPPMMMVLDSLGMLSSEKELEDTAKGENKRDMTKAQLLRGTFRVLSLKLAKANVPLLVTNHVYDVVGAYVPTKEISGGSGLKYAASSICMLSKKKDRDGNKDVIGNIIKVGMHKSRFTKENKVVEVKLSFDSGLDRYYGLLDLAEKYDIIKKVSTRYELPDGTKVFGKAINENPEKYFTDEILKQLEEAANKEFMYGQIGVDEQQGVEDASEISTD